MNRRAYIVKKLKSFRHEKWISLACIVQYTAELDQYLMLIVCLKLMGYSIFDTFWGFFRSTLTIWKQFLSRKWKIYEGVNGQKTRVMDLTLPRLTYHFIQTFQIIVDTLGHRSNRIFISKNIFILFFFLLLFFFRFSFFQFIFKLFIE